MNFPPYQYPKLRYIRLNFDIIDFELKKYKVSSKSCIEEKRIFLCKLY